MSVDIQRLRQHEDSLTVVKGCVATLLRSWDRLSEEEREDLLQAALTKTEFLVYLFEEEVAPLELNP